MEIAEDIGAQVIEDLKELNRLIAKRAEEREEFSRSIPFSSCRRSWIC